jgi:hypothetical protein
LCDKKSGEIKQINQNRADKQPAGKREIKDTFCVTVGFHDGQHDKYADQKRDKKKVSTWLAAIIFNAANRSRLDAMVNSLILRVKATKPTTK